MGRTGSLHDAESRSEDFPSTRWSLVTRAGGRRSGDADSPSPVNEDARREALGHLLTRYLPALRAHLLAKRIGADRADDLLQGFVADKLIERNILAAADRVRGRFRAFLVTALDHFAANQFRQETAGKRAPRDAKLLAWDPAGGLEPNVAGEGITSDAFDLAWARQALAAAVGHVRAQCHAEGRTDLWEVLEVRVLAPALDGVEPLPYPELVRRFGYASPKHAANALVTAKRRLEQALRAVVAEYVSDEGELQMELASLAQVLAAAPHAYPSNGNTFGAALRDAARGPANRDSGCAE